MARTLTAPARAQVAHAERLQVPDLHLRADIRPDSIDLGARTVELIFSTGAPVDRFDWFSGHRYVETLSLEAGAVRLGRLNNGAPFLDSHSSWGVSSVIGVIEPGTAKVTSKRATATVRFSKRADVEPIWQDVRDGILRNVSVGYRVHKYEKDEGSDGGPVRMHAADWEPFEISAVPIGADDGSKIRSASGPQGNVPTHPCEVIIVRRARQETVMVKRVEPNADGTCPEGYEMVDGACVLKEDRGAAPAPNPGDPGAPHQPAPARTEPDPLQDASTRATLLERERCEGIQRAVRSARLPVQLADKLIKDGTSLTDARGIVLDQLNDGHVGPQRSVVSVEPVAGGPIDMGIWRGIENALLHRVAPGAFKLSDAGRNYRGLSLIEVAKCCLQARGIRTTGLSKMEVAGYALGLDHRGGMHTTSDFALILADVANKTLRRAYEEAPQTYQAISRRTTLPDFKMANRVQLGEAPQLTKVLEHGEFKRGTIGEGREQYQLATYGRIFAITRKALVNDDTDAFSRLTVMFGRSARDLESNLVWEQITLNGLMGDGFALFSTEHANLDAVPAAIGVGPIGLARAAMRKQKGVDAVQRINITPKFLIVPTGKETLADQFTSVNMLASAATDVNPFGGKLGVIAEPRLDDNSATAWYLAASPEQIDMIEYAHLEGEEGPVVETRLGFDVDGLEVKCRHDFAAKVIDWRGFYKNPGA